MLTLPEKIFFVLAVLAALYAAWRTAQQIVRTIARGKGRPDWQTARSRLVSTILRTIAFQPVFRFRFWPSLFHAMIGWGFIFYLLVNLGDMLEGFISEYHFLGTGTVGHFYRLGADLLSVVTLTGMIAMIIRRFGFKPATLTSRSDVLLQPQTRAGIRRDSAIVSGFIMLHIGSRFLGESFQIAISGADSWQPFASAISNLWKDAQPSILTVASHVTFWLALGTLLLFIPYFIYSKHIHIFLAPLNLLLRPARRSIGELDRLNFDDESIEQFGASRIEDLGWELILDSYACIMCFRCQEVCPAYNTGKVLSPAAMEINKRYYLNSAGSGLAKGEPSQQVLWEYAIPPEAIWACTACGACVDICPVGNEPMRDILQIRRALVLMENEFPEQLQTAFRGMERTVNPWNVSPAERMKWAEGLEVPTIEENPEADILWWVGCAPATDARAQKTAQAFAKILNRAGVNFAVLGQQEQCTGDSARRAGNEFLFNELASANVEMLNEITPKRIVTTCPHCLHTLSSEYPAFGGNYQVVHHTQLIQELIAAGSLKMNRPVETGERPKVAAPEDSRQVAFHDPCYLGRQNGILDAPRQVLDQTGVSTEELPRSGRKSFCCGAGGGQMWKEEEAGSERVNANRFREAQATGVNILAVGCPFCMVMLTDAKKDASSEIEVLDVAEIVLQNLEKSPG